MTARRAAGFTPAVGEHTMHELAPGVWQLRGLVPHFINSYLVGDVLVDSGTRWAAGRILRQLRGRPLALVALTHCHPDHLGSAAEVCLRRRVPLACHEDDAPAVEGKAPMVPRVRALTLFGRLWAGPPHPVAWRWRGGEAVADFRVIHAPGHTPGEVVLFRESDSVAIVGDVLRNLNFLTGRPELGEPPPYLSADPARNRESARLVLALKPSLVCFGHGPPLRDVSLLERYAERLGG